MIYAVHEKYFLSISGENNTLLLNSIETFCLLLFDLFQGPFILIFFSLLFLRSKDPLALRIHFPPMSILRCRYAVVSRISEALGSNPVTGMDVCAGHAHGP